MEFGTKVSFIARLVALLDEDAPEIDCEVRSGNSLGPGESFSNLDFSQALYNPRKMQVCRHVICHMNLCACCCYSYTKMFLWRCFRYS